MLLALALLACKGSNPPTDSDPVDTDVADTAPPPSPTADTGPTVPIIDCGALPGPPFENRRITGARGYHGLAFDSLGHMVGGDNSNLLRVTAPDDVELFVPNVGTLQQIERLPDDSFVAASDASGQIIVYDQDGSQRVLANGIGAYGVTVGPDGLVYTANLQDVHRIDPVAETVEVWLAFPPNATPKVLDFSPDLSKMYVGTISGNGRVYVVELDGNLDPVGAPTVFATGVGGWHDGLRVDACGNLYIAEYTNSALYKVTPDGDVSVFVDQAFDQYGHGVQFGSGIGEWNDHAIYMPQPYDGNTVLEGVIGVPHWSWNDRQYVTIGL